MTKPRDFSAELKAARDAGDWDAHAAIWEARRVAEVETDEAALNDDFDDAAADRWTDGALDGLRNNPKASDDPDYLAGHAEGLELRKVRPVMPERPEGYYHVAPEGC